MAREDGGPAFPPQHDPKTHQSGMTLRDYFAAAACASMSIQWVDGAAYGRYAKDCYAIADAMLEARK